MSVSSVEASSSAFPETERTLAGSGLTKREMFALAALQGILAHSYNDASYQGAARDAVAHADALLAALAMPAGGLTGDDDE